MISKILASRTAVAIILGSIIIINLFLVSQHEKEITPTNSKNGLDAAIDAIMSDEYTSALKNEMLDSKKSELLQAIRKELRQEYESKLLEDLKHDIDKNVRPELVSNLKEEINKEYTKKFFDLNNLNYAYLRELKQQYLTENKRTIKELVLLDSLDSVLKDVSDSDQLKEKVAQEIDTLVSKKDWYTFVLKDIISASAPTLGPLNEEEKGPNLEACRFANSPIVYDKEFLTRVKFSKERFDDFATKHREIVEKLLMMDPPPPSVSSGEGIVISGGGAYMAGAITVIMQARDVGSKLPIELIINTREEYDEYICEDMGRIFNFKCVIIEDEIGKDVITELNISKFQLKMVGLLVSSFDHIITLDADNMPIKNPDNLLCSESYTRTEFLLWPDIWQRTISSTYYEIAGIKHGELVRRSGIPNDQDYIDYLKRGRNFVHFHDLDGLPDSRSTESGQMVFSKRRHYRAFILSLYYNIYGETHYWRMFYQGSPGSGDRDTFVPALHVFGEAYEVVGRATWLAGFNEQNGRFQETTIVQYDPDTTSKYEKAWKDFLAERGADLRLRFDQDNGFTRDLVKDFNAKEDSPVPPEVFFLHIHRPKINPVFATSPEGYFEWNKQRNLGLPGAYKSDFGDTDWDLKFYSMAKWVACKGIKSEKWWKSVSRQQDEVCAEMTKYVEFLKKDSKDLSAESLSNLALE